MTTIVRVRDLSKVFETAHDANFTALEGVSFDVESGEFVVILGPSGCGKTTLIRILQGVESPTKGQVDLASDAPPGFVFQSPSLFPWLTVAENISFALTLRRHRSELNAVQRGQRVADMLALTGLAPFRNYYPHQISGGMQQRANLGRALAINPSVLLMDEPFSALDAITKERLQSELGQLVNEVGITTVFITHDIREAIFLADRVLIMSAAPGQIVDTLTVPNPRPRSREFQHSEQLAALARRAWKRLDLGQTNGSMPGSEPDPPTRASPGDRIEEM